MKIEQDPHFDQRFVIELDAPDDEDQSPLTPAGMLRAKRAGTHPDGWFHTYASARLARQKNYRALFEWLRKTKAECVWQPVVSGERQSKWSDGHHVAVSHWQVGLVFLDRGMASLFKLQFS